MRAAIVLVAALGLAACGEFDQVVVYEQGKYQGKPDTRPWDNAGSWERGDREDWERLVKRRQLTQNENGRMY